MCFYVKVIHSEKRKIYIMEPEPELLHKGWSWKSEHKKLIYDGFYDLGYKKIQGKIEVTILSGNKRFVKAWIFNPPASKHPKRGCLHHIGQGWFGVHWAAAPTTAIDAVLYLEKLLDEMEHYEQ